MSKWETLKCRALILTLCKIGECKYMMSGVCRVSVLCRCDMAQSLQVLIILDKALCRCLQIGRPASVRLVTLG